MRRRLNGWGLAFSTTFESSPRSRSSDRLILAVREGRCVRSSSEIIVIFDDVSEESRSVEILHVWHGARDEPMF